MMAQRRTEAPNSLKTRVSHAIKRLDEADDFERIQFNFNSNPQQINHQK
jgi:hypothetical protein